MQDMDRILDVNNYFDSVIITDDKGVILYYVNGRADIYWPTDEEIVGKTILELHPELTADTSSIMRVLRDGKPIYDQMERFTREGQQITNRYSTLPLIQNGKIVGALDLARCVDGDERQNIVLPPGEEDKKKRLYHLDDIIACSAAMGAVKSKIPKVAHTDSSVLLCGETGTGKEMIAQALHTYGSRKRKRFVSQNCAAIPSNLLEGILFGTVKGSYTGAENRKGLFEIAQGGTLFLDEINSMDLNMQAKLLKAIEEKKVTRLGGLEPISVDVKIISAMNRDPLRCLEQGQLREDLFYRLNVVQINVPPLRERHGDLNSLTRYFIAGYNQQMHKNVLGITDPVWELFQTYSWPGNVRELQNIIEGAFNILGAPYIRMEDLPPYLTARFEKEKEQLEQMDQNMPLVQKVELYEKRLILKAVDSSESVSEAARRLKLSKQALNYKLKKYGIHQGE